MLTAGGGGLTEPGAVLAGAGAVLAGAGTVLAGAGAASFGLPAAAVLCGGVVFGVAAALRGTAPVNAKNSAAKRA